MALTLNTNIDSLTAQNNLSGSQALLSQSLTRLSSGLRINSAADDAAGLAISQQFQTQINGTNQAINNANNAISEAQTAGGALSTIVNNLQSIRTLAVEAANGSNSASDRQALDQQVQQQIAEITRIASQTSFNGASVLNGSSGTTEYQVGANVGDTISVNLAQGVQANQIGQTASGTATVGDAAFAGGLTLTVGTAPAVTVGDSTTYATSVPGQDATSAYAKAAAINAANAPGLSATASTTVSGVFTTLTGAAGAGSTYGLTINGVSIYDPTSSGALATGVTLNAAQVATQINQYSTQDGGVVATDNAGTLTLSTADGTNIAVNQTLGADLAGGSTGFDATVAGDTSGTEQVNRGSVTLTADSNISLGGTAGDLTALNQSGTLTLGSSTLANQNVLTLAGANSTIYAVDSALSTVSQFQSQLGAIQNRFTSAVGNLTTTAQNLTQSRSTIVNANFAQETANLTQSQVLEQAGISVLAQANSEPQLILKLLP
jgi:flagellin